MKKYLTARIQRVFNRPPAAGDYICLRIGEEVELDGVKTLVDRNCIYYFRDSKGWELHVDPQPTKIKYVYEKNDGSLMVGDLDIRNLIQRYIGGFGTVKGYEVQ